MATFHGSGQLVVTLAVLAGVLGPGTRTALGDTDWRAGARDAGLEDADIEQLARDGILITNQMYKQVFTPYLGSGLPRFVTSDSLLNAYHVLYEESVRRLEQANARRLPDVLRFVLRHLDGAEERVPGGSPLRAAARRRANIVVGTALRLLDDTYEPADESIRALVQQEVERIVGAQVEMKPAWLGPPQDDLLRLDYNRYKVRGFYTQSETLTRYFRAVAWLQSIPFRVANDEELLSILMLGSCITPERFGGDEAQCRAYRDFFGVYRAFLGAGDDWDLVAAADEAKGSRPFDLAEKRQQLTRKCRREGGPQINDQIRFVPEDPNVTAEANFRIISAYRLPEAVLFQRTTDIRQFKHRVPNGLELCIALGSAFARDRIDDREKAKLLQTIDESRALFAASSLYGDYLRSLAALLDAPDDKAPAFMKGRAWQAKSCGTVLAGWAQFRHTWVLQAKSNWKSAGRMRALSRPKDFVEPEPEFFRRMSQFAGRTCEVLRSACAFDTDYFEVTKALVEAAALLEKADNETVFRERIASLRAQRDGGLEWVPYLLDKLPGDGQTKIKRLRKMAADLEAGTADPLLEPWLAGRDYKVEPLWRLLEQVSQHLESIARKQLAGVVPGEQDSRFLDDYGKTLAALMLYGGSSYEQPRDDAPRTADVFWHHIRGNLHAGIGRPRTIYVLYPWEGTQILCRGAVLPYYEFFRPARLTDSEWKSLLDSDARPNVPTWFRPIIGHGGLLTPGPDAPARGQPAGRTR